MSVPGSEITAHSTNLSATCSGWPWWRHQMETFPALLAFCAGNSPVISELITQRPVKQSFVVFFDLRLNNRLSKQSWGWWFETPSHPLWRHSNEHTNRSFVRAIHQRVSISWRHYGEIYRTTTNWISFFASSNINWSFFVCLTFFKRVWDIYHILIYK